MFHYYYFCLMIITLEDCYGINEFPHNSYSKVMVIVRGAFGGWLDHEHGALRNGLNALVKRDSTELTSLFHHLKIQWEVCKLKENFHQTMLAIPDYRLSASETVRNKYILFINYPVSGVLFSSVQSLSRVQLFAATWTAAHQASLSFINAQSWLKFMSIESVMPYNHFILCRPLLLLPSIFPSIRVFSNESVLLIRWPKYWSFSFSFSPSNEYSGLISFRTNWLALLAV